MNISKLVNFNISNPLDLIILYKLLNKGDKICGETTREIKKQRKNGKIESKRISLRICIEIEKKNVDPLMKNISFLGRIVWSSKDIDIIHKYHSIKIGINSIVKIEKEKFNENLNLLSLKKFKPLIKTNLICILLEEHSYLITEINENGVHILDKFEETLTGKEDPLLHSKKTLEVFNKAAASLIKIFNEKKKKYDIAVFGPSIFIQDFLKILRKENPKLSNFIKKTAYVSSSSIAGIEEVLRNRLLIEYEENIPLLKGVDIMEKILEKMAKGENIFSIGLNEVIFSLRQGAAEKILMSENFLWNNLEKKELDEILDLLFKTKAELIILPNNIESGEKLESFGGIISLNRWGFSFSKNFLS
ncbi:MAG: hypothetical protein QXV60_01000 [Nitrososphaerota archaeon]